ncbi:MAG: hypothetical protein J5449_04220 [Oscillospiraceae bacterium]|nr:hypothetical protein [Oscillospiraceae bacterium]
MMRGRPRAHAGTVNIPAGTGKIADVAFKGCYAVTGFAVAEGNTAFSARDGMLLNARGDLLVLCPHAPLCAAWSEKAD